MSREGNMGKINKEKKRKKNVEITSGMEESGGEVSPTFGQVVG